MTKKIQTVSTTEAITIISQKTTFLLFSILTEHEDYHQEGDTPDKINYPLLAKRTQLIFYTAWELANRSEKIKLNKS